MSHSSQQSPRASAAGLAAWSKVFKRKASHTPEAVPAAAQPQRLVPRTLDKAAMWRKALAAAPASE